MEATKMVYFGALVTTGFWFIAGYRRYSYSCVRIWIYMDLTRRDFVAVVSTASFGAIAGCVSSSEVGGSSDNQNSSDVDTDTKSTNKNTPYETTSISILASGNKTVETAEVPVSWKRQTDKAVKVNNLVYRRYGDLKGFRSGGIVNSNKTVDGLHYSMVEVEAAPGHVKDIDEKIPNEINGIQIKVVKAEPVHEA